MKPAPPVTIALTGSYPTDGVRDLRGPRRLGQDDPGEAAGGVGCRRRGRSWRRGSRAGRRSGERIREVLLHGEDVSPVGRGRPLRRRPRGARRTGDPPGARARRGRRVRPLPRLLARVPGDRAKARNRGGPAAQPHRRRRAAPRPDVRPACSTPPRPRSARGARATASSAKARSSTPRSTPRTGSWASSIPNGSSCSTARSPPDAGGAGTGVRCSRISPVLERIREQDEAKRLLEAALRDGPAHAYLLPRAAGRRQADRGARVRRRAARRSRPRLPSRPSRPVRARAARRPDPDRRHPPAPPRPAHAAVRGRPARVRRPRGALDERGRGGRAAQGPRGAAALRRVILLLADELGSLPETIRSRCQPVPVPPAVGASRAGGGGRARAGTFRRTRRRRSHAWPAGASTGWSGCSTRRRPSAGSGLLAVARSVYRDPEFRRGERAAEFVDRCGRRVGRTGEGRGGGASSSTSTSRPARGSSVSAAPSAGPSGRSSS